ncbi:uncharacterized protein LY89DRAFT_720987 [Mollisia scopiformis]|uniref:Rhodopsin domain-containing protein n=1 Tax=Mollisia scopiformis TaxID=149040 RepID=A0A194X1P9_MOLSC|nr:uncharacterized protein LY89DRAFT_720987 [Mollisia scopiformis]KUJ13767.1 hypothetical protein LY89DRAFT_720987 [Mollisia scopiformis]
MSSSLPLPAAPTGNRFALVTPDDDSAPVTIVTMLSSIFTILVFAVRLGIVKRKRYGYDDCLLSLGHVVALGQWAAIFIALDNGLGKSTKLVGNREQNSSAKALFAGRILLILSLCFSKLSILLLTRSLFHWEKRRKILIIDATIVLVIIWGLGATLALSIDCSPHTMLGRGLTQCSGHVLRLRIVMIIDIITECIIFGIPILFLYAVKVANGTKLLVIAAFAFRLPLVAFSIMYLLSFTSYIDSKSSGTAIVPTMIWQEILLGYSLMSATIPCLKAFVEGFTTGGGRLGEIEVVRMPYESEGSYELGQMRKNMHRSLERLENIEDTGTHLQHSRRRSRRSNSKTIEEASIRSQTSEQPIIGMAI